MAVQNLILGRAIERYRITFLFGLIHGFGFSNVLREMQLPRANLALSLFSFNLGVEIGQVVFVVLLFPVIEDLVASGWKRLRPAVSITIACLATYWFVPRAFFGSGGGIDPAPGLAVWLTRRLKGGSHNG